MKARDRFVLGLLALAGLMAALWFGVLAPKREEAASLSDKVAAAEQRRDAANAEAGRAEQARATYRRDYASVARLGKATPPQADVPSLVYQLESAARRAHVDFRSVTVEDQPVQAPSSTDAKAPSSEGTKAPSSTDAKAPSSDGAAASSTTAGIETAPFSFIFEGSFFKLHELLRSIDRFSRSKGQTVRIQGRLLTLDAVTLSAGRAGFPQVKAEITARAYVAPVAAPVSEGGTSSTTGTPNPNPATPIEP